MDINLILQKITIFIVPFLLAVTVHELAHGLTAKRFGDRTAEMLGRLTLNPLKHIEPMGTVIIPLVLLLSGSSFLFGWAKPVPVNTRNLKNPKKSMALVAAAGPISNVLMAIGWALLFSLALHTQMFGGMNKGILAMAQFGVIFNVLLAIFNMLPLPPLDGGRVAVGVLPHEQGRLLSRLEPYGMFIIVALLFTGILFPLINPLISGLSGIIFSLVGVG
jgi:Zn-dependent protease